jgi:uncharacterized protein (DUF2267 family)/DNA-binding FrmR family transcriptional regulator
MRKTTIASAGAVAGVVAALLVRRSCADRAHARRQMREAGDRMNRRLHRLEGRWQGVSYRLKGRHPDPDVPDQVLADRIRSSLGPLEKSLDLPHVHVMVEDHTAMLHGEVATNDQLVAIEEAVARVSGVVGVESYLHVGLIAGDTRPSEGRRTVTPSRARGVLVAAARDAGVAEPQTVTAVRAVLGTLAENIPADELGHVRTHLPADVHSLMEPPRRTGAALGRVHGAPEFVAAVLAADGISPASARHVIGAVLGAFKTLVPEEVSDVAAVLPTELRELWEESSA